MKARLFPSSRTQPDVEAVFERPGIHITGGMSNFMID